ncbi:MAG: hypothetical protein ICV51_05315 [Flavisolibacter sp.]|nr:hypothetical protein [Flavisolibacter sp.]MBD0375031.1 hypothetical protein [Flavisolibacter sp.]
MKRKTFPVYIFALIGLFSTCRKTFAPSNIEQLCVIRTDSVAIASKLLTLSDAVGIMGEPAKLTCNTFIKRSDTLEYKCDYTALSQDEITGKTGKLYFMYEVYAGVDAAANAYSAIYQANSKHEGVEIVSRLGNEAYYHSDGTGFYFFLVRKNEKMFRMKLNKVTRHSSAVKFKEVAKLIADKI